MTRWHGLLTNLNWNNYTKTLRTNNKEEWLWIRARARLRAQHTHTHTENMTRGKSDKVQFAIGAWAQVRERTGFSLWNCCTIILRLQRDASSVALNIFGKWLSLSENEIKIKTHFSWPTHSHSFGATEQFVLTTMSIHHMQSPWVDHFYVIDGKTLRTCASHLALAQLFYTTNNGQNADHLGKYHGLVWTIVHKSNASEPKFYGKVAHLRNCKLLTFVWFQCWIW